MSAGARRWLAGRRPPPPEVMRPWLEIDEEPELPVWESLMRSGLASLERARAMPGRVRESAYHLLTADALLTYACEAALEDADPEGTLARILGAVGAGHE